MNCFNKTYDVMYSKDILKTLKLDQLLYIRGVNILDYLTTDINILERRSKIYDDTNNIPEFYEYLSNIVKQLTYVEDLINKQTSRDNEERNLYSIKQMELFFDIIDCTMDFYSKCKERLTSEDYIEYFQFVAQIFWSKEYKSLKCGVAKMMDDITHVKSISLGFNFDASLNPYEAGILSVNKYYIESGTLIDRMLRMDINGDNISLAPLVITKKQCRDEEFNALDEAIYRALSKVFKKQIRQWEPEINSYLSNKLSYILGLLPSFKLILKIIEIQKELLKYGLKLCKPKYRTMEERYFNAKGLYNPVLAIRLHNTNSGSIIKNDLVFDDNVSLYILTGPNSGGKSVFLSSVCIIQLMSQLGMLVPAYSLEISPVKGIFVHMTVNNTLNENGRLADECFRIKEIFQNISEYSLCVFDEAYSSTDLSGALELSEHLINALSYWNVHAIFSTHLHELERCVNDIKQSNGKIDYLSAGISENGKRTYHIERGKLGGKSYASNIAEKMGVTYNSLIHVE